LVGNKGKSQTKNKQRQYEALRSGVTVLNNMLKMYGNTRTQRLILALFVICLAFSFVPNHKSVSP
jgi:hypothetical protein